MTDDDLRPDLRAEVERNLAQYREVWGKKEMVRGFLEAWARRVEFLALRYERSAAACKEFDRRLERAEADAGAARQKARDVAATIGEWRKAFAKAEAERDDARAKCERADAFGTRAELARLKAVAECEELRAAIDRKESELREEHEEAEGLALALKAALGTRDRFEAERVVAECAREVLRDERDAARREAEDARSADHRGLVFSWERAADVAQCAEGAPLSAAAVGAYYCWIPGRGEPTHGHPTLTAAACEAQRLANKEQREVTVLRVEDRIAPSGPAVGPEPIDEAEPFPVIGVCERHHQEFDPPVVAGAGSA